MYSSFGAMLADDDEKREAAFRLRYQVYCVEHRFEDPADNPGGRETDAYDPQSVHAVLMHLPSGEVAGTVRLILPEKDGHALALPIRRLCRHPRLDNLSVMPLAETCEISRFAISKVFRRRSEDGGATIGGLAEPPPPEQRRMIPHLCLGLMSSILEMCIANRMSHLAAVMEPALLRMLARLGIHFFPLGPLVDFHGRRQPCHCDVDLLLARVWVERREVWEVLTRDGALRPVREELARAFAPVAGDPAALERRAHDLQMDSALAAGE